MPELPSQSPQDIFLLITTDKDILNPALPAAKFISDIGQSVSALHIIYLGDTKKSVTKVTENTWLYTTRRIPFFAYFSVYRVILAQLVWKRHFQPTIIVSMGDEINLAKRFAHKYKKPLYAFYAYMKVLGREGVSMHSVLKARPQKIFAPNAYVGKALTMNGLYNAKRTEVKILTEYIDVPVLEKVLSDYSLEEEIRERNKLFNMVVFPRHIRISTFSMIQKITKELLTSIAKFQFTVVVKRNHFLKARFIKWLLRTKIQLVRENDDSASIFLRSRLMLYFEKDQSPYEPILYSFIAGCPVLSSGDEHSKTILFHSGLEEYGHIAHDGTAFGITIKKLINDPYLYTKYRLNCVGFAKTAFTHDHNAYLSDLKLILNTKI